MNSQYHSLTSTSLISYLFTLLSHCCHPKAWALTLSWVSHCCSGQGQLRKEQLS